MSLQRWSCSLLIAACLALGACGALDLSDSVSGEQHVEQTIDELVPDNADPQSLRLPVEPEPRLDQVRRYGRYVVSFFFD
jgi:hypothetical protein